MQASGFQEIVLAVEHLTVYQETYMAVQDVSFVLPAGTDTAIVGPNGAGKTTLVQAVLGILPHQGGTVTLLGKPLSRRGHLALQVRQQVAYLPQSFLFDRRIPMTVAELVGLGWDRLESNCLGLITDGGGSLWRVHYIELGLPTSWSNSSVACLGGK